MDRDVLAVQKLYPRIYMACHVEHVRSSSSRDTLSPRDATILAHLSDDTFTSPTDLARHLNVSRATVSEATSKLCELGYITTMTDPDDERKKFLMLTERGMTAVSRSSVLDYEKLRGLLTRLSGEERRKVIEGLALLAGAAERA